MHQFQIDPLFGPAAPGDPFVFTNSALWMLIVLGSIWLFMMGGMKRELVPGRWQMAVEGITKFIYDMVDTNIGPDGRRYVPWIFTIFVFILMGNMLGMIPGSFTFTSHIIVTFGLALTVFRARSASVLIPAVAHMVYNFTLSMASF